MTQLLGPLLVAPFLLPPMTYAAKVTNPKKPPKNAVLLSNVKSLTLRAGQRTTSRRVSPIPQLQCVGPPEICKLYNVDVMRCTNEGADYDEQNIQWSCKASVPEDFKLGGTEVICEGYESSDDPFILKGSCGVEYRLLLTDKGEERFGKQYSYGSNGMGGSYSSEKYANYIFMTVFLGVLFFILYSLYKAWRNEPRRLGGNRPGGGGYGGGGGGGGGDDPPPPYDPFPPRKPTTRPSQSWFNSGSSGSSSRSNYGTQRQQEGWRPGFWTGTMAGAAAGYMAGNRNQARTQPETMQRNSGGWFGGGGGESSRRQPSSSGSSSADASSTHSTTHHSSTGFGGTRRR